MILWGVGENVINVNDTIMGLNNIDKHQYLQGIKKTRFVTMNIFRKKNLFKSFVKIELSYIFTINMVSTA